MSRKVMLILSDTTFSRIVDASAASGLPAGECVDALITLGSSTAAAHMPSGVAGWCRKHAAAVTDTAEGQQ